MSLLFVYGTLLPELNLEISSLFRKEADFMGRGFVYGDLYDLGQYPGMVLDFTSKNKVFGYLYQLKMPAISFELLDEYEGINMNFPEENEYIRACVNVIMEDKVWIAETYLYIRDVSSLKKIDSGHYLSYLGLSAITF